MARRIVAIRGASGVTVGGANPLQDRGPPCLHYSHRLDVRAEEVPLRLPCHCL